MMQACLTQAKENLKYLEQQPKQRLNVFLLRNGLSYRSKSRWIKGYWRWLDIRYLINYGTSHWMCSVDTSNRKDCSKTNEALIFCYRRIDLGGPPIQCSLRTG